ncbi:hypothetical protein A8U91_01348 [Halomonas elongata]|uniref:Chromosome partition protein Smc n=1 Tax=Halomonas elongata TaxID=2746 RepID=A0A1B8P446_HALEL|nr:hypothetical protein [Halomonas elongata]OBX37000.1 hypothetical protein A8U91_01348 [Halomonas elongata]
MQAPFAFDSDGNLVISAYMVEVLGLGKRQDSDDTPDAIRFDQISTEAKARAEADSALASDLSALESRLGDAESALETEQLARSDGDSALASRARSLEARIDAEEADGSDLRSRVDELESKLRGEVARLESMIQSPRR